MHCFEFGRRAALVLFLVSGLSFAPACDALGLESEDEQDPLDRLAQDTAYYAVFAAASTAGACSINDAALADAQFVSGASVNGQVVLAERDLQTPGGLPIDYYLPQSGSALPLVVMLQGANVHRSYYSNYAARVASAGFVVAVPDTCRSIFFNQFLFASAATITDVQTDAAARSFAGRLDANKLGLLGHSLGSVVGIDAMRGVCRFPFCEGAFERPAALQAGVFFGASSDAESITTDGRAVGLIQGAQDSLNEPADASRTYGALSAPRALISVDGVDHYGLTDTINPEDANPDPSAQTLSQAASIELIGKYSAEFLKATLNNDASARTLIFSTPAPESGVGIQAEQ